MTFSPTYVASAQSADGTLSRTDILKNLNILWSQIEIAPNFTEAERALLLSNENRATLQGLNDNYENRGIDTLNPKYRKDLETFYDRLVDSKKEIITSRGLANETLRVEAERLRVETDERMLRLRIEADRESERLRIEVDERRRRDTFGYCCYKLFCKWFNVVEDFNYTPTNI